MFQVKKQYSDVIENSFTSFTLHLPPDLKAQIQARQEEARAAGLEVPEVRDYLYAAIFHPQAFSAVSPAPAKRPDGCKAVQFQVDRKAADILDAKQLEIITIKSASNRQYSKPHLVCEALRYCFSL